MLDLFPLRELLMPTDNPHSPVLKRHREEAARAVDPDVPAWLLYWVESGNWREVHGVIASVLARHFAEYCAQSLANTEAAIHARYAGLVEAAKMRRDELDEERCALWTVAEEKLLSELEKLMSDVTRLVNIHREEAERKRLGKHGKYRGAVVALERLCAVADTIDDGNIGRRNRLQSAVEFAREELDKLDAE